MSVSESQSQSQAQAKSLPTPPGLESWGPPLRIHEPWTLPDGLREWLPRLAYVLLILAPVFFIPEAIFAMKNGREFNPVWSGLAVGCLVVGIILLFTISGIRQGVGGMANKRCYYVYPDALVVTEGGEVRVVRWGEVKEYTGRLTVGGDHTLVTRDDVVIPLDNSVRDFYFLITHVAVKTTEALLPPTLAAVQAGRTAEFGPFGVDLGKLHYKDKAIAWGDIAKVVLVHHMRSSRRELVVSARGRRLTSWCKHDLDTIPNSGVFYRLFCKVCPPNLLVEEEKAQS